MSSSKYGSFNDMQIIFRDRAKREVEDILSAFDSELKTYSEICRIELLKGMDKELKKICDRILSQIASKSITRQSFSNFQKELVSKLHNIYLRMREEIYNQSVFLIEHLQEKIKSKSREIEPEDFQNLLRKLDFFTQILFQSTNSKDIKEIVKIIEREQASLSHFFDSAIERRSSFKKKLNEIKNATEELFHKISKINLEQSNSEQIELVKTKMYENANIIKSKEFKDQSLEKILKFELKRANLLEGLRKELKEIVFRDNIASNIKFQDGMSNIDDFISLISSLEEIKERITNQQSIVIKKINFFKNEIMKLGFPEYQLRVKDLTEDIENESIDRLEMIRLQLETDLYQLTNIMAKTKDLKSKLYPLKLLIARSELPEAKEVVLTIEDLLLKPSITEESINKIERKIAQIKEKEEKLELLSEKSKRLKTFNKVITEELEKLGYYPHSEINMNAEPVYIDTPQKNYKLKIACNQQGEMLCKFIRIVGDKKGKESITDLQKQKDISNCRKWGSDYDILMEHLAKKGIIFEEEWRKMPEIFGVEIEVNKELYFYDRKKKSKKTKRELNLISRSKEL